MRWIEEPNEGDVLFKMTMRVIRREHGGYCSDYDFEGRDCKDDFVSKDIIKTVYFKIPEPNVFELNSDNIQDGEVIENDDTEPYFLEWTEPSDCDGSGYCQLNDTFIPIKIEYVQIT